MKAPIRQIIEALDGYVHFLPDAGVRKGREHHWLHAPEVAEQLRHYGAWVNFWGVCCGLITLLVPGLMLLQTLTTPLPPSVGGVSAIRFVLCFPAVMLAVTVLPVRSPLRPLPKGYCITMPTRPPLWT